MNDGGSVLKMLENSDKVLGQILESSYVMADPRILSTRTVFQSVLQMPAQEHLRLFKTHRVQLYSLTMLKGPPDAVSWIVLSRPVR